MPSADPFAALTVEQAYTRYALRVDPSLPRDDLMPAARRRRHRTRRDLPIDGGPRRRPPESPLDDPQARSWTVGARVPHVVLAGTGDQISTLDTANEGFAFLVEDGHSGWREAVSVLDIPVAVYTLKPATYRREARCFAQTR